MTFDPFTVVTGPAVSLPQPNIDTDVIIRVERMTSTDPAVLGAHAFEALRGPGFPYDTETFRGAPILLGGANFGCGSSREPAVWALQGLGVRCLAAPSFGDIFRINCQQNGVLAVTLPTADLEALAARTSAGQNLKVDLGAQAFTIEDLVVGFTVAPLTRAALLAGLDDLELTLRYADDVRAWEARDQARRPWAW